MILPSVSKTYAQEKSLSYFLYFKRQNTTEHIAIFVYSNCRAIYPNENIPINIPLFRGSGMVGQIWLTNTEPQPRKTSPIRLQLSGRLASLGIIGTQLRALLKTLGSSHSTIVSRSLRRVSNWSPMMLRDVIL